MLLEKTLKSPLDSKVEDSEINPEYSSEDCAEAEAPVLWPSYAKSRRPGKDPDAGKDRRQKEEEAAEDEMIR